MKNDTSKARQYCEELGHVGEKSARVLKKFFPAYSQSPGPSTGKRRFDPTGECVASSQHKKKKAGITRAKPKEFSIVLLPRHTVYVPKGYQRSKLSKKGRVVKVSLRRNMSEVEVDDSVTKAFSSFDLEKYVYLKCGQDNRLKVLQEGGLSGNQLFDLAGQGSIYIIKVDESDHGFISSSVAKVTQKTKNVLCMDV